MDKLNGVFTERLKELRQSTGLNQSQFAEKAGLSKTTLSNYENLGKSPSLDSLIAISTAFKVSLDWLCGTEKNAKEQSTLDVLLGLTTAITALGLDVYAEFPDDSKYGVLNNTGDLTPLVEINSLDRNLCSFLQEYNKMVGFLNDNTYPDYLKQGIKSAFFNKYRGYGILGGRLLSPEQYHAEQGDNHAKG